MANWVVNFTVSAPLALRARAWAPATGFAPSFNENSFRLLPPRSTTATTAARETVFSPKTLNSNFAVYCGLRHKSSSAARVKASKWRAAASKRVTHL